MKNRKIKLGNDSTVSINDNEWNSVVNRKEFDANGTEILRVTRHTSGLMTRVYAMRAAAGQKVHEVNEIVVGDNLNEVVSKAVTTCGLTRISADGI